MEEESQIRNSTCVPGFPPILNLVPERWEVRCGGDDEVTTGGQAGTEFQGHHLTLGGLGLV